MEYPIDFVVIWVDGADPAWQAEKARFLPRTEGSVDAGENRYRDWDNLRYWFRAVERYAPWVNRVHLVTWGHLPHWLNPGAPRLHIVRHRDYITPEYLHTFSSHPIELNLHRIDGLAERFVYFNDDQFLTAPVSPEDFFRGGLPCDSLAEEPVPFLTRELYNAIRVNDLVFLNRHYGRYDARRRLGGKWFSLRTPHDCVKNLTMLPVRKDAFFGLDTQHLPQPYLKSSFSRVWELDRPWLEETCSHRFRDDRDISQFAVKFSQMLEGNFVPYDRRRFGVALPAQRDTGRICRIIRERSRKALCANDSDVTDFAACRDAINRAFADALPEKSSFER